VTGGSKIEHKSEAQTQQQHVTNLYTHQILCIYACSGNYHTTAQVHLTNKIIGMGLCFIYYSCSYTNYCNKSTNVLSHTRQLQNVLGITLLLRNTKQYNQRSYVSSKIFPLCNHKILPANAQVLGTFLEAILLRPFQLFRRILTDVSSITKHYPFNGDFSRGKSYKSAAARSGVYG